MRVIECDTCGETLSAADDTELARTLAKHMSSEHDETRDQEELEELVAEDAYDAMDA